MPQTRIENVALLEQNNQQMFHFRLSGDKLLQVASIEHFNEHPQGVNRKLDYKHVMELVNYMSAPNSRIVEPILGDLSRKWKYDKNASILVGNEEDRIVIDDGQHRIAALQLMDPIKRDRWNFLVIATIALSYEERLKIFSQQGLRKPLDPRLLLQIADRTNSFRSEIERDAYQICLRLNTDVDSPLRYCILMEEKNPAKLSDDNPHVKLLKQIHGLEVPYGLKALTSNMQINVVGIMPTIRKLISSKSSSLCGKDFETQYNAIKNFLLAAHEVWPTHWKNMSKYFIRRTTGVSGLLLLFVMSSAFKLLIDENFTQTNFQNILVRVTDFDWSFDQFRRKRDVKFPTAGEIAQKLDIMLLDTVKRKKKSNG